MISILESIELLIEMSGKRISKSSMPNSIKKHIRNNRIDHIANTRQNVSKLRKLKKNTTDKLTKQLIGTRIKSEYDIARGSADTIKRITK